MISDRDWVIDDLDIKGREGTFQKYDSNKYKITDIATIASYLYDFGCITEQSRNTWNDMNYPGNAAFITRNVYKSLIEKKAASLNAKMIISHFGDDDKLLSLKHIVPGGAAQGKICFYDSLYKQGDGTDMPNSYVTSIIIYCKNNTTIGTVKGSNNDTTRKPSLQIHTTDSSIYPTDRKIPIGKYEVSYYDISHNGPPELYMPTSDRDRYITVSIDSPNDTEFTIQTISLSNTGVSNCRLDTDGTPIPL